MKDADVGPDVADLLLAGSPHLLEVVEVLLDRGPIGERLQDVLYGRVRVGAEESRPAAILLHHQYHADDPAGRRGGGPKRLVGLLDRLPIQGGWRRPPAALLPRPPGPNDPRLPLLPLTA